MQFRLQLSRERERGGEGGQKLLRPPLFLAFYYTTKPPAPPLAINRLKTRG